MERKKQYQGPERRKSQSQYQGEERRKPDPLFEDETLPPRRKEEQEGKIRQHDDTQ